MCYSENDILLVPKLGLKEDGLSTDYFISLKCKERYHFDRPRLG